MFTESWWSYLLSTSLSPAFLHPFFSLVLRFFTACMSYIHRVRLRRSGLSSQSWFSRFIKLSMKCEYFGENSWLGMTLTTRFSTLFKRCFLLFLGKKLIHMAVLHCHQRFLSSKCCSFEHSVHQRILEKYKKKILSSTTVFNIDNKCFLSSKSAY